MSSGFESVIYNSVERGMFNRNINLPPNACFIGPDSSDELRSKLPPNWESAFFCNCGRSYKLLSSLRLHWRYECGREPTFSCKVCHKKFHHKGSLKRHLLFIHSAKDV